jgi:8-oxo-dGTP pyrophosphatase MutT (NUDIX family)
VSILNPASVENILNLVRVGLKSPLPGKASQDKMAPAERSALSGTGKFQRGSVLILLYPHNEELFTVFIKRTIDNTPHSGQISFPGGRIEPGDTSLQETALRETEEETGVFASEVEIIGSLTPLYIEVSNVEVTPFVGACNKKPVFRADPREVDYLIEVKISELLNDDIIQYKTVISDKSELKAPVYNIGNHYIWGATAMILSEFLDLLKGGQSSLH